jgi:hypothetical protein
LGAGLAGRQLVAEGFQVRQHFAVYFVAFAAEVQATYAAIGRVGFLFDPTAPLFGFTQQGYDTRNGFGGKTGQISNFNLCAAGMIGHAPKHGIAGKRCFTLAQEFEGLRKRAAEQPGHGPFGHGRCSTFFGGVRAQEPLRSANESSGLLSTFGGDCDRFIAPHAPYLR